MPRACRWALPLSAAFLALILLGALLQWGWRHRQLDRLMRADPDRILADPALARIALPLGRSLFAIHCAGCHGPEGEADRVKGVPDLRDGDYLYGVGRVSEIEGIVLHGIRGGDDKGWNLAAMPAYGTPHPYRSEPIKPLRPGEIRDVVQYLLAGQGRAADAGAARRGRALYVGKGGCYDCHGQDRYGDSAIGAPNLSDRITLYGDGSAAALYRSIAMGRAGVSPAFAHVLSPVEARAVAVYAGSLNAFNRKKAAR
ncbi:MAG TPA: c-type cytochrome [Sphingomonadaceae bacterium]|nr:c-type cytochrome [Sphingomonadaceae bacterium]